MSTLAEVFDQENLISISKQEFRRIRQAVDSNRLLEFTRDTWKGGDRASWCIKTKPVEDGKYLLVEHFESKGDGKGIRPAYKVDTKMYQHFLNQQ